MQHDPPPYQIVLTTYAMRPLYVVEGEEINWNFGLRAKGTLQLDARWAATLSSDIRYHRKVNDDTDQIRFPQDLEVGLAWESPKVSMDPQMQFHVPITAVMPVDTNRREDTYFQGGLRFAPHLDLNFSTFAGATPAISIGGSFQKNFHKYETQKHGSQNSEYETVAFLAVSFVFTNDVAIRLHGERWWSQQYNGSTEDMFAIANEIALPITQQVKVGFGHVNKSKIVGADQRSSNVHLLSEDRSLIYGMISYIPTRQFK